MKTMIAKVLPFGLLALLMMVLMVPSAAFAEDPDANVNIASNGLLEYTVSDVNFPDVQLGDGIDKTAVMSSTWGFRDKTNTGDGWHVVLNAGDFNGIDDDGNAATINNDNLSVKCDNMSMNDGSANNPDCSATTLEAFTGSGNVTLLSAAVGYGMGDYSAQLDFSLFIDGYTTYYDSTDGYQSDLTITISTGP